MKKLTTSLCLTTATLLAVANSAHAEITILEKNKDSNALLAPLSLQFGGSIRPEFIFNNGPDPGYYKNGHDGGTRFRFSGDYALSQHTSVIAMYEMGVDLAKAVGWDSHYPEGKQRDTQRKLYAGIKDDRYGTVTYGHQYGIYYEVVGMKSDVWDNDGHASGTGIGINGNYDGANRAKNSIKYKNTFGDLTVYANYLLPEDNLSAGDGLLYRRNSGQGLGFDYNLTKSLTLSTAYIITNATMRDNDYKEKKYHQQLSGTALTWQPGNWYIVGTASYYKDFVPSTRYSTVNHYFAGSGYGLESFVGYTFNFDAPWFKSVQPYIAADSLRLKGDEEYHANHTYLGVANNFGHGLSLYVERTLASTSDNEADATWITLFYDF